MSEPAPEPTLVTVKVTIPVEGADVGDEIRVEEGRARWLLSYGYAARVGEHTDDVPPTKSSKREDDPTLAENRESGNGNVPGLDTKTVNAAPARKNTSEAKQDRTGKASGVKSS